MRSKPMGSDLPYFVDSHTGRLSTDNPAPSNRFEERLAIAL